MKEKTIKEKYIKPELKVLRVNKGSVEIKGKSYSVHEILEDCEPPKKNSTER